MAYTPDPERAKRDLELTAQCQELLLRYRRDSAPGPLVKALASLTRLTTEEVETILEERCFTELTQETDPEARAINMFHVASGLAERSVCGFTVQPY